MLFIKRLLITVIATLACQNAPGADPISYSLTISQQSEALPQVHITFEFIGEADGETLIQLPDSVQGEQQRWKNITDLKIEGTGSSLIAGENPTQYIAHHQPGARLKLSYRVIQNRPENLHIKNYNPVRPIVQPEYIHLLGSAIFLAPAFADDYPISIQINKPDSWSLASDLENGEQNIGSLSSSIIVAGDYRIHTLEVDKAKIRIAIRGEWDFSDADFSDTIKKIVQVNFSYWNGPAENFLVTLLQLKAEPRKSSMGGRGLEDAFASYATRNIDTAQFIQMLTHEYIHSWNPGRLGGWYQDEGKGEARGYWFSEGFTDFLTQRIGVRAGLWSTENVIYKWNEVLTEYASSPVIDISNSKIVEGFWSDANYQRLPYIRGMLFAAYTDHRIRAESSGRMNLDDVLVSMKKHADTLSSAPGEFIAQTLAITGVDLKADYQRFILDGEILRLDETTFGACGTLKTLNKPVFDYGMTGHRDEKGMFLIETVDPAGPAMAAGFQPGMVVVKRLEGAYGDATIDSVLRIEIDGETRYLRYRPTNGDMLRLQQIVPGELILSKACTDSLSGYIEQ